MARDDIVRRLKRPEGAEPKPHGVTGEAWHEYGGGVPGGRAGRRRATTSPSTDPSSSRSRPGLADAASVDVGSVRSRPSVSALIEVRGTGRYKSPHPRLS